MAFNPNEHLMQLKNNRGSSDYLEVKWRLVWFRTDNPNGTIETEEVVVDMKEEVSSEVFVWNNEKRKSEKIMKTARGYARFKATVTDGKGGKATGHGSESAVDFPDFIEKAETKAVGRALAMLGYGTQFTGDELSEAHRIVDAPVAHPENNHQPPQPTRATTSNGNGSTQQTTKTTPQPAQNTPELATDKQIASMRKLCEHLGKPLPDTADMSFNEAWSIIKKLTDAYNEQKQPRQNAAPAQPSSGQNTALTGMIAKSKQRVEALGMIWVDVKRDAIHKSVEDADLTLPQSTEISKLVTQYEENAGRRTAASAK